jgi:hypothetical protein
MGAFTKLVVSRNASANEYLRINKKGGHVSGSLNVFRYRDKDTRQIVLYCPSLDISGYGADENKAHEMIKFSLAQHSEYLISLSAKNLESYLNKEGWKHDALRNKEFSKAYVDASGELQNFNAVGDKVEQLTLVAA